MPDLPTTPAPPLPTKIARAYQHHVVDYQRVSAFRAWLAFIATFVLLRALTYGIRYHLLPFGNIVTSGGLHIHHFVWGILLLLVVGFLGVMGGAAWHPWLAIAFGVGAALVIDEFALWLNLRDVYWAREGRLSVDVAILIAALLGLYYAADRFWRQVAKDVRAAIRFALSGERRLLRRSGS